MSKPSLRLQEIIEMNTSSMWRAEVITDEFVVIRRSDLPHNVCDSILELETELGT